MKANLFFQKLTIAILLIISVNSFRAQCAANFAYTNTGGGVVNFTSTSVGTNSNTQYFWNFGYGGNFWALGIGTASCSFPFNGVFTVTLSIQDSLSPPPFCTSSVAITLTVNNAPCTGSASFSSNLNPGGLVNFNNFSNNLGPAASYNWGFGDGGTSNLYSPSHTYSASGVYNVTLTATDQFSICSYSTAQSITVSVGSCSLTAAYSYSIGPGGNVSFSSTSTGTSVNTNYYWTFGDGSAGSGSSTAHTYTSNGTYNVFLNIADSIPFLCTDTLTQVVNLTAPCFANVNFLMQKDTTALPAIVWNAFPNYPLNITAANWSWGDGSNTLALFPSHTYSAAGFYNICVTITVSCGSSTTACSNTGIFKMAASNENNAIAKVNVINPLPAGIKNNLLNDATVKIFPNPNNGEFEIILSGTQNEKISGIKVYNLLGQEVYSILEPTSANESNRKVMLNELSNGSYFVTVVSESGTYKSKIIINR